MDPYPAYPFWKIYAQNKMGIDTTIILLYYMYIYDTYHFHADVENIRKGSESSPVVPCWSA